MYKYWWHLYFHSCFDRKSAIINNVVYLLTIQTLLTLHHVQTSESHILLCFSLWQFVLLLHESINYKVIVLNMWLNIGRGGGVTASKGTAGKCFRKWAFIFSNMYKVESWVFGSNRCIYDLSSCNQDNICEDTTG